jgi:ribosomal protein L37AE/L43A
MPPSHAVPRPPTPLCAACGARVPPGTGLRTAGGVWWCKECAPAKVARESAAMPHYKAEDHGCNETTHSGD